MRFLSLLCVLVPCVLGAQEASVRVRVQHEGTPVSNARVTSDTLTRVTTASGVVVLRLAAGAHWLHATRIGFSPDSFRLSLAAGGDTTVTLTLERHAETMEAVVVSSTRSERRVEDTPVRVEVIDEEEIAEKVAMT